MSDVDLTDSTVPVPKVVPEQDRNAYPSVFDQVAKLAHDMERVLNTYHALFKDDQKAKLIVHLVRVHLFSLIFLLKFS